MLLAEPAAPDGVEPRIDGRQFLNVRRNNERGGDASLLDPARAPSRDIRLLPADFGDEGFDCGEPEP